MEIIKRKSGLFDIKISNQAIGCGSMIEDDSGCYLERIDIDLQHRGKGYGTQALHQLRNIYGSYYLAPDNADAKRLYDRICDKMDFDTYSRFGFAIDQGFGVYVMD